MEYLLSKEEMQAVINGDHGNVFAVLGIHRDKGSKEVFIRAYQPNTRSIEVLKNDGTSLGMMTKLDDRGFYQINLGVGENFAYRFKIENDLGNTYMAEDAYRFQSNIGDIDAYLFAEGTHLDMYKKLGAHPMTMDGVAGVSFAVWAPNAKRVSVVGGFNNWDGRVNVMRKHPTCGVWDIFIPGIGQGELYKYEIKTQQDYILVKSDPVAFYSEKRPNTASVVYNIENYHWEDENWMNYREQANSFDRPMSVYEVHLGSWRRKGEHGEEYLTYREFADYLVPYVGNMGFTHVEFLPLSEHPLDASWGYQVTGMFAPTSRFGNPDDFRYMIDKFHQAGIGVIMDWVPAHFPRDEHGLAEFDGTRLFECKEERMASHPEWGTLIFDYEMPEVQSFLISSACFFFENYHIDGIRVDAVSSMLYLNYGRKDGEYTKNREGGNINLGAVSFLRKLNTSVLSSYPGAVTIAEESTAYPMVTMPPSIGGLGFSFKWDMGYMHDTLDYFSTDPLFRKGCHDKLTFSMMYAFSENFILAYSHDEVVHGKKSMLDKMFGSYEQKFATLRALYGYQFAHPGKKLCFMGSEFGQFIEWNYQQELDWLLLDYPMHEKLREYYAALNHVYGSYPALYEIDNSWDGFKWLNVNDNALSSIAFLRSARPEQNSYLICACNFIPNEHKNFIIGLPMPGTLREILSSDDAKFGGSGLHNVKTLRSRNTGFDDLPYSASIDLPPLSAVYFEYIPERMTEENEKAVQKHSK